MCRVYKAKTGWFVRLCYYHRERKGEHVPVSKGYELQGAHYPRSGGRLRSRDRQVYTLTFSVTSFTNQTVIDDMARYAGSQADWDRNGRAVTLSSKRGWKNAQPIVDRAVTFGWKAI